MDALLFNFHDLVLMGTMYQCLLFGVLLLVTPHKNRISQVLLACFLFTQAAIPMDLLVNFGAGFRGWALEVSPDLFYIFGTSYWLEGPLLLWYTRSLTFKNYQFRATDTWSILPAILFIMYIGTIFWSLDPVTQTELIQNSTDDYPITHHMIYLFREILRFSFGVFCLIELHRYNLKALNSHSDIERIDLSWLKFLIVGFLIIRAWAILVSFAIITSKEWLFPINYSLMGLLSNYGSFVLICALIFQSLSRASKLEGVEIRPNETEPANNDVATANLNQEESNELLRFMTQHKPFLRPSLTLEQLASQLSWPQRNLSNLINRKFGKNFFEFVNEYRIAEAKRLLSDKNLSHKSITDIMYDAGFNSKATFNTYFKKITRTTPSQYRKDAQKEQTVPSPPPST